MTLANDETKMVGIKKQQPHDIRVAADAKTELQHQHKLVFSFCF